MHGDLVWFIDHFSFCYLNCEEVGDHVKHLDQDDILVNIFVAHEIFNFNIGVGSLILKDRIMI